MLPNPEAEDENDIFHPFNKTILNNLILTEIGEKADTETDEYYHWTQGTHKYLESFRNGTKLRSLYDFSWQITALLYLNPQLTKEEYLDTVKQIINPLNGLMLSYVYKLQDGDFLTRIAEKVYNEQNTYDWANGFHMPVRKRVVVFKDGVIPQRCSQIIGKLCHQPRLVPDMVEECMWMMKLQREKITVTGIARVVKFSRMQVNRVLIANPHLRDEQFKFNQLIKEHEKLQ